MKNLKNELIERIQHSKKRYRRYLAILLVLSMVTVLGVDWGLHQNGISMTADYECGKEPHEHSDACYTATLICGQEETDGQQGHTHSDSCYDENGNLICGSEESAAVAAHHHTDDCYSIELTCGKEAHVHTAECLLGATFDETSADTSDTGDNTNLDGATDGNADAGSSFDAGASGADFSSGESGQALDSSADVETSADWEKTLPEKLTGVWADDLALVAESQIGYHESTQNFKVDEVTQTLKGYTRYGAWYGNEYGDWTTMFAAFCLKYADIPETSVPINSGCESWIVDLKEKELYQTKENYTPEKGDIVFLDIKDKDQKADRVGIIDQIVNNEDGTIKGFYAIVGDSSDAVEKIQYTIEDEAILGYLVLPEKPSEENPDATPAPDENTDGTDQNGDEPFADEETNGEDQEDGETTEDEEFSEEEETDLDDSEEPTIFTDGDTTTQTVETENYTVSVSYTAEAEIPDGAKLKAIEYGEETEEYVRACEEAGKTFDWLIDISFYLEDEEIEPNDSISISVVAKNETAAGKEDTITEITHFAETGIEVIQDKDVEVQTVEDGQTETSFELDSLSLVAGTTYKKVQVIKSNSFTSGSNQYLIYKVNGNYVYFLAYENSTAVTFRVPLSEIVLKNKTTTTVESDITDIGDTLYLTKDASIKGEIVPSSSNAYTAYISWTQLCWTYDGSYLKNVNSGKYLNIDYSQVSVTSSGYRQVSASEGSDAKYTKFSGKHVYWSGIIWESSDTNYLNWATSWNNNTYFSGSSMSSDESDFTLAMIGGEETGKNETSGESGNISAVYTGTVTKLPLGFYTVQVDENKTLKGIEGVHYTIYNSDGNVEMTFTTSSDMRVNVSALPAGSYTMKMTEVPEGYVCDADTWSFTIGGNGTDVLNLKNSSGKSEGVIIVNKDTNLTTNKTASVKDYEDRTYQVDLSAKSDMKEATIDELNVHFVIDQSNSMLFPADMNPVDGLEFTVKVNKKLVNSSDRGEIYITESSMQALTGSKDGTGTSGKLDKNTVYYFIADASKSSTVYALYYEGGNWKYQDASFFAKAYYEENYPNNYSSFVKTNDVSKYPSTGFGDEKYLAYDESSGSKVWCSGGYLAGNMVGCTIQTEDLTNGADVGKTFTYKLYTSTNEYNRLHYLEQSLSEMLQMLAAMNPETNVTLDLFTNEIKVGGCLTGKLNNSGLKSLLDKVGDITTDGGTRQDIALEHTYSTHMSNTNDKDHEYVILITDGAPANSKGNVGEATDEIGTADAISSTNTIYKKINYWANQVQNKATLATVGLGMKNVASGSKSMAHISTNGPSVSNVSGKSGEWWFQPENSSEITSILCDKILNKIVQVSTVNGVKGVVKDEISDSFYPINIKDNTPVTSGTRIDAEGNVVGSGQGIGTIYQRTKDDENGKKGSWYVQWDAKEIVSGSFTGRVYLKAKEDFIGGNAINTNKSATLTLYKSDGTTPMATYEYNKPTVNVHLLEMKKINTKVTVYKGDTINEGGNGDTASPLGSVKYFFKNVEIQKLVEDGQKNKDVLNKVGATEDQGCKSLTFTIPYALSQALTNGDFTADEWSILTGTNGKTKGTVTKPYTYNEADGEVGYFTFELEKTGVKDSDEKDTSDWNAHKATIASQKNSEGNLEPVETYTLEITYTAYKLNEGGRPEQNVYNGTAGPGTEVDREQADTNLNSGYGIVKSENVHKVYVIDGTIRVWKEIDEKLKSDQDQTYTFTLYRQTETTKDNGTKETTSTQVSGEGITNPQTVTIEANKTKSSETTKQNANAYAEWTGLERGTYVVMESVGTDANYIVESITVITGSDESTHCNINGCSHTNCFNTGSGTTSVSFTLGNDTNNQNVISKANGAMYTSYTGSPNGVLGEAVIKNKKSSYTAEIPVEKKWNDADGKQTDTHENDTVYVALYKDDTLVTKEVTVTDASGNETTETVAQVLKLQYNSSDTSKSWKGTFHITLANKNDRPTDYSIKEIKAVSTESVNGYQKAQLEGTEEFIYFNSIADNIVSDGGYITINEKGYKVSYTKEKGDWTITENGASKTESVDNGKLVVTNARSYDLPKTGGFGTRLYTTGGLAILCLGLMYGYSLRRKRERRVK